MIGTLLLLVLLWRLLPEQQPDVLTNHALQVQSILPLLELHHLDGGWVGVIDDDWGGLTDSDQAWRACVQVAEKLGTMESGAVSLMDSKGLPVVDCPSDGS